jgi:hypothetical protein
VDEQRPGGVCDFAGSRVDDLGAPVVEVDEDETGAGRSFAAVRCDAVEAGEREPAAVDPVCAHGAHVRLSVFDDRCRAGGGERPPSGDGRLEIDLVDGVARCEDVGAPAVGGEHESRLQTSRPLRLLESKPCSPQLAIGVDYDDREGASLPVAAAE